MKRDAAMDFVVPSVVSETIEKEVIESEYLPPTGTVGVLRNPVPSQGMFSVFGGCGIFISFSGLSC